MSINEVLLKRCQAPSSHKVHGPLHGRAEECSGDPVAHQVCKVCKVCNSYYLDPHRKPER